jgi:hypothetical protein
LVYLLLHSLGSLGHCFPSNHLLLHEAQTFVFLVEARQFILDDRFDLFFGILFQVFTSFGVLRLVWVLGGLHGGVHGKDLRLVLWLLQWLVRSSELYNCLLWF